MLKIRVDSSVNFFAKKHNSAIITLYNVLNKGKQRQNAPKERRDYDVEEL